ncbi:TetR/AcrR family transcriptional regulator [Candidatus Poribacteria bacterium]|nr:TetR/AcrR family transcriptional regulator [Candidatus Poribacteria bacterium]
MSRRIAAQDRVAEIVKAAISVFCRKGFRQAQMSEIASEAGVSHGTLYTYFASKEHLFSYVMENGAPGEGKSMPPPEASSARSERDLLEILKKVLRKECRLKTVEKFLRRKRSDVDMASEIREIMEEWWDIMERNRVQIAILDKSQVEFPELSEIYDKYGRRGLADRVEVYLSDRSRLGLLRPVNSITGAAHLMQSSLSLFSWKQLIKDRLPALAKAEVLPDLIAIFTHGLIQEQS